MLRGVRTLLHEEGYTIKGVQRLHKEQGLRRLMASTGGEIDPIALAELEAAEASVDADAAMDVKPGGLDAETRERLEAVLEELQSAKARLDALLAPRLAADS